MKTKMKALALALCAVLLVVSTVFITMAFLTDKESVKNTFTFGQVGIKLDEADVDVNGVEEEGKDRVQENEYHLIPGHKYVKDPTIHVDDNSENCLLFVKLENGLQEIIAHETLEEQMAGYGWTVIDASNNIWAYDKVVAENTDVYIFKEFKLADDADVSNYGNSYIIVTAYAVQANGFVENTDADASVSNADAVNAWTKVANSFGN